MTPDDLRALAARVLGEEPSEELRNAVLVALGWKMDIKPLAAGLLPLMQSPAGHVTSLPPNPLTSHDAAFGAMPAGWRILAIEQTDEGYTARIGRGIFIASNCYTPVADIPRAVTAAGLLARAADMEAEHAE